MRCKKVERWIFGSFDQDLEEKKKSRLDNHLEKCLSCRQKLKDYQLIKKALQREEELEPSPYFWERLKPKLKEKEKLEPWFVWKKWSLRAIPVSLALLLVFLSALIFLFPEREELSQTETILLKNANPLVETQALFDEEKLENRNMMIIFAAGNEKESDRRYSP